MFLNFLVLISLEIQFEVKKDIIFSDKKFVKLELYPKVFNALLLINSFNTIIIKLLSFIYSNNAKAKKII